MVVTIVCVGGGGARGPVKPQGQVARKIEVHRKLVAIYVGIFNDMEF